MPVLWVNHINCEKRKGLKMKNLKVLAHTSFLGETGFADHSQNFFKNLNKIFPTRIRNYSYDSDLKKYSKDMLDMIIEMDWQDSPYKIGLPYNKNTNDINIVLNEVNHYYFWDNYSSPLIFYTTWETTKKPQEFFNRLLIADQIWVPSKWERNCMIEQGCPKKQIKVVKEGIDPNLYYPCNDYVKKNIRKKLYNEYNIPDDSFTFCIFGRWDYRKSIEEMIQCFNEEFKNDKNIYLIISSDNPFSMDDFKSTEERLEHYKLENEKIRILHFPPKEEYIQWIQTCNCYLSASRSEGWGLPLIQALACATPSIASECSGQMEYAHGLKNLIPVTETKAGNLFGYRDSKIDIGNFYEPDFDYFKKIMRDIVINYNEHLSFAKKYSLYIKEEFNWKNAANIGAKYITELSENTLISIPNKISFKTNFELTEDNNPKITFTSSNDIFEKIIAVIKDDNDNIIFKTEFENIKQGIGYWVSCNKSFNKIIFELFDFSNVCLYSESKIFENIKIDEPMELYQDQYINGTVITKGRRFCEERYDVIKTVFDKYKRPFTILDIGANFGYYSIRAATEYDVVSVMVEKKDNEVNTLIDLCNKNNCKDKLIVLQTCVDLNKLKELVKCEHFDVVLALNVIHHFNQNEVLDICKTFIELGDNLILETPPLNDTESCGQENIKTIIDYFQNKNGTELGKFKRHTSNTESTITLFENKKHELIWPYYGYEKLFTRTDLDVEKLKDRGINYIRSDYNTKTIQSPRRKEITDWIAGINLKTFIELNGRFPNIDLIVNKLQRKDIIGDYKWDNSNNDLITHNFILNGNNLHIIDYNDKFIEETNLTDNEQLENVIFDLSLYYDIKLKDNSIKLNLGCGNDIKPGYINIDKYNNTGNVDMNSDLGDLPFDDHTISEIYTSHVFEHIPLNEVYSVISEWKRALKIGGRLVLRLPDLETEVKIWLQTPDDKKWFDVHRIFGAQSHPGNTHYIGFNPGSLKSFLETFNFKVIECKIGNRGFGDEIQCIAINLKDEEIPNAQYICHFVNGPFIEIKGDNKDKGYYQIDFLDPDNNSCVHQATLKINQWTQPYRKYFTNWAIKVSRNGILKFEHNFDLKNKNVLISFDSKSLGDTIAWIPQIEVFRQKHNCNILLSTFWNYLFEGSEIYKNIKFINPGTTVDNLYASYAIGTYENDKNRNPINWRLNSLQKVCSDILGLEYKEIIPELAFKPKARSIQEKYITISEWSTFQCKHWNYAGGWQTIIDFLNDNGWKVVVISKEKTNLKNIVNRTNRSIEDTINTIYYSDLYMGVSSGPAWLAWALKVPVVMISGYSKEWAEFSNCERIINKNVCNGCFNDINNTFDKGDWNWCPRHKNTPRQFECTKYIYPSVVIESVKNILKI